MNLAYLRSERSEREPGVLHDEIEEHGVSSVERPDLHAPTRLDTGFRDLEPYDKIAAMPATISFWKEGETTLT